MGKKVQNSQHFLTTIEGLEQVKLMVMLAVMLVKTLSESEKPHGMKPFLTSSKRKDSEQRNISGVSTEACSNVAPRWSSS